MKELFLSQTLKDNKAVIVRDGQDCPDGYVEVAGAFTAKGEISIAVPEELMQNEKLIKKLSDEAGNCIMKYM